MLCSVVVVSKNNVIGCENDLVFNIKEDLKRFKEITSKESATMIMGRKTFESLPGILPNRKHVIITKNKDYFVPNSNGQVEIVTDVNEIINKYAKTKEEVFVIGGGQIFDLLNPYTDKHYITYVDKEAVGDTFFNPMDLEKFELIEKSENHYADIEDCNYYYADYLRK